MTTPPPRPSSACSSTKPSAPDSPFRAGPLHGLPDVEKITLEYVDWYNNRRLHGGLDHQTPDEYEQAYCTQDHKATTR